MKTRFEPRLPRMPSWKSDNHNTLDFSKAFNIIHTLMGNFCHGDKDKISQREDMGNNACLLLGYHDKVCIKILYQIIHINKA